MVRSTLIIGIFLLLLSQSGMAQQRLVSASARKAMSEVSFDAIWKHASVLAHDSLGGRGMGARGEFSAATYIAEQLRLYGLFPAGEDGSYFQYIPMHGSRPLRESKLQIHHANTLDDLGLHEDYVLYKTGAQTFIPQPLPMVFVGYGIIAPEFDYNDYQNIDVSGAIVVFLAGEPPSIDDAYFDGTRSTIHSIPEMKQRIALARGASGSVLLPIPRESAGYAWADWLRMFSFEDITLPITVPSHLSVMLNPERADKVFRGSRWSWEDVLAFDSTGRIRSFFLTARMSFAGKFHERDFITRNVAGILKGSDPLLSDSWVLCTAHFDHLGIGPAVDGDSIYNGLVDNALGTAGALELARRLSREDVTPRRSILFLFVTGEEKGLLGSQYYCERPLVPLHKTTACLNIDGIGITDEFDDIVGIGSEYSTLGALLEKIALEIGLTQASVPPAFDHMEAFASSDQIAFAQAGIPSLLVMEGMSYRSLGKEEGFRRFIRWGRERYHSPFDDLAQPVDRPAVIQHVQVLLATLSALAETLEPPQWIRGAKYINARLQSLAEER